MLAIIVNGRPVAVAQCKTAITTREALKLVHALNRAFASGKGFAVVEKAGFDALTADDMLHATAFAALYTVEEQTRMYQQTARAIVENLANPAVRIAVANEVKFATV